MFKKITNLEIGKQKNICKAIAKLSVKLFDFKNKDAMINYALKTIGEACEADRAYIFDVDYKNKHISNSYEWVKKGVSAQIKNLQKISFNKLPWWIKQLKNNKYINILYVNKLPLEAIKEKKHFKDQNIKSLITIPIVKNKKLVGFMGFDSVKKINAWSEETALILEISSRMTQASLEKYELYKHAKSSSVFVSSVIDKLPFGICIIEKNGNISYANPIFSKIINASIKQTLKLNIFKLYNKRKGLNKVLNYIKKGLEGQYFKLENISYISYFTKRKVTRNVIGIPVLKQKERKLIFAMVDTTEQKQTEEKLKSINLKLKKYSQEIAEKEEQCRLLFDKNSDAIYLVELKDNKPCNFLEANKATLKRYGYSKKEFLNFTPYDITDPDIKNIVIPEVMKKVLKQGEALHETIHLAKNNKKIPIEINVNIINYLGKKCLLVISRDISERKRYERELKNKIEELEKINKFMIGREMKMIDLKEKIKKMKRGQEYNE